MANSQSYEGRVSAVSGTGPRNLPKSGMGAKVASKSPRPSRAPTPSIRPGLAGAGGAGNPPRGGGGGIPKTTSPMARPPRKTINKPKTGSPKRGLGKPRADIKSRI